MLARVLFARLGGFPSGPLAVFFGAARAWVAAEFLPVFFCHVDAVIFGRLLNIGEGELAILVRDADSLIETRNRVPDMARVGQRLFALLRKGKHAVGKIASLSEIPMLLVRFLGCMHRCVSICPFMRAAFPNRGNGSEPLKFLAFPRHPVAVSLGLLTARLQLKALK